MNKGWLVVLAISIVVNVILSWVLITSSSSKESPSDLTELEPIQESKDSLEKEIDTVYLKIDSIVTKYEKDSIGIVNNNTSEDYIFFINYLSRYDSIHNSRAVKNY